MNSRFGRRHLFSQLAISLGVVFVVLMAIFIYWLVTTADQRLNEARQLQALGHARMLANSSRDALLVKDYVLIDSLVEAARPSGDYAYAMLTRPDGTILVHTDPGKVAHHVDPPGMLANTRNGSITRHATHAGRPVLEIIYPAVLANRHLANAHVAYYLDTPTLLRTFSPLWFVLVPVSLLVLLAGITLLVVRRVLTDPIDRLTEVMANSSLQKQVQMPPMLLERDDEIGSLARAFQGLSDRLHQSYQALAREEEYLQEAVEQRTAQLQQANKELEAFSYSVSHDLRAPLRAIEGFMQAIVEEYLDKLPEGQCRDYFSRIQAATRRMSNLIDDLLKLSHLTRHEVAFQNVDLAVLAKDIVETLRAGEPQRRVQVRIQPELAVLGDSRLLRIVMENLLGNAWKFTRDTADACIEVGLNSDGKEDVFYVCDNGAGFDDQYAERMFQPFQRLHSIDQFEGTGIGLAIVQRIIQRHGGRVWAEGGPDGGACIRFCIDVPRRSMPARDLLSRSA